VGLDFHGKVAVVNHGKRFGLVSVLILAVLPTTFAAQSAATSISVSSGIEKRAGSIDMVLLLDKSLSMAPFFAEVKNYVAKAVIRPILEPGDRLIVETVYGRVDRLLSMTITSTDDVSKALRAIQSVKADGRFTDLGRALDVASRDLGELGKPEVPKYVLLITDERQEAPKDSPYQTKDYKLKHPSLAYIKRVDLGKFRAITVGLQVEAKVTAAAAQVMQLLAEPPVRGQGSLGSGSDAAASDQTTPADRPKGTATASEGGSTTEKALPAWLLYGTGGILLAALAAILIVLVVLKKKGGSSDDHRGNGGVPTGP
jgi:hypothetical protein